MRNIKVLGLTVQKLLAWLKFKKEKKGQTSRTQGKKCWYPRKGFVKKNTHVNYQSSNTHYSKVIIKVKVSKK